LKPLNLLWSRESDSNRRPADYESAALPTELSRLIYKTISYPLPFPVLATVTDDK
jgi:hypothetical protein